jgi:DNA polymerase III gamma/tau subunit
VEELHLKYRPNDFDELVGQDEVGESIKHCLDSGQSRVFLLSGESGVGKTTMARIIANRVGAEAGNVIEVDAATYSGVEHMRALADSLQYHPMGDNPARVVILDEVHRLSQASWSSCLKVVEEPPPNVYWVLCTTELNRVPDTIRTRTSEYRLSPVGNDDLFALVSVVAEVEEMGHDEYSLNLVCEAAAGSPRRALVYLSQVSGASDRAEVARLLRTVEADDDEVLKLARMLTSRKGLSWANVQAALKQVTDKDSESVRLQILSYVHKAALNTGSPDNAAYLLTVLDAFSTPCDRTTGHAQLLLSAGTLLFSTED